MAGKYGGGAIKLFQQHEANKLMRPGRGSERDRERRGFTQARRKPIGRSDNESDRRPALSAPSLQPANLAELEQRAERQRQRVEVHRLEAAQETLVPGG